MAETEQTGTACQCNRTDSEVVLNTDRGRLPASQMKGETIICMKPGALGDVRNDLDELMLAMRTIAQVGISVDNDDYVRDALHFLTNECLRRLRDVDRILDICDPESSVYHQVLEASNG